MKYYKIALTFSFFCTILVIGCSDLKNDITPPADITMHQPGFAKPGNPNFHGFFIKDSLHWDMRNCRQCHGGNYGGGITSVSCNTCHTSPAGPENCSTCHGSKTSPAPPNDLNGNTANTVKGVGAHQVHLAVSNQLSSALTISCSECHSVPGSVYQPGHVDTDQPAEVLMHNYMANINTNEPGTSEYDSQLPLFAPDPQYDYSNNTCANTYCHGTFKNGNISNAPVWTNPEAAACGTCHGDINKATLAERALPKTFEEGGTHSSVTPCYACHGDVVDENLNFVNKSKHIDGKLNLFGNDIDF